VARDRTRPAPGFLVVGECARALNLTIEAIVVTANERLGGNAYADENDLDATFADAPDGPSTIRIMAKGGRLSAPHYTQMWCGRMQIA